MNEDVVALLRDLIINMSSSFMFCVVAFFGAIAVKSAASAAHKSSTATDMFNLQKLQYEHEINKMAEQRKLIEQQVSSHVAGAKRLSENES